MLLISVTVLASIIRFKKECLEVSRASFFFVTAEDFAKSAIQTIGIMDETTGCFSHQLQVCFLLCTYLVNFFEKITESASLFWYPMPFIYNTKSSTCHALLFF